MASTKRIEKGAIVEITAFASPLLALSLLALGVRGPLCRAISPVLFLLAVGAGLLGYLEASRGDPAACGAAVASAAIAGVGLIAVVLRTDARLRVAEEIGSRPTIAVLPSLGRRRRWRSFERDYWAQVAAVHWARNTHLASPPARRRRVALDPDARGQPTALALYSFVRPGRRPLFVFVRQDPLGRLLEAATYDPDDYD
jgi:hypothetical protein